MVPRLNNESVAHMGYTAYSPPPVGYLGARRHARAEERRVVGSRGRVVVAAYLSLLVYLARSRFIDHRSSIA